MTKSEKNTEIEEIAKRLAQSKRLNKDNPNTNPGAGKNYLERDIWNLTQELTKLTGIKFKYTLTT